jgi:small subunit ribosomal protein S20
MANHKSAIKRTRANETKRKRNRYLLKKESEAKGDSKDLPKLLSSIDKLAKKNVYHKNKASNLKSKLMKRANKAKAAAANPAPAKVAKVPKAAKAAK